MRKDKSWTRQVYEQAYAAMRRGFSDNYLAYHENFGRDIMKAADYSYQAKDYDVHGWSNNARRKRFHAIKYRALSYADDIPL